MGEGPLKDELQKLINDLNLQERVFLAGFQSNPYAWVARCRLFVLSSHAEGFPNALLEAMGLGRPVISTDCHSGPRELLSPDCDSSKKTVKIDKALYGILTPRLEQSRFAPAAPLSVAEQAMADALTEMLSNPSLIDHYARQSNLRARDFTRDSIIQQWISLIDSLSPEATLGSDQAFLSE